MKVGLSIMHPRLKGENKHAAIEGSEHDESRRYQQKVIVDSNSAWKTGH